MYQCISLALGGDVKLQKQALSIQMDRAYLILRSFAI